MARTAELRNGLADVAAKTISLARANLSPETSVILFHYDLVYATLRGIACDSNFQNDAGEVTVCHFIEIDIALGLRRLSNGPATSKTATMETSVLTRFFPRQSNEPERRSTAFGP